MSHAWKTWELNDSSLAKERDLQQPLMCITLKEYVQNLCGLGNKMHSFSQTVVLLPSLCALVTCRVGCRDNCHTKDWKKIAANHFCGDPNPILYTSNRLVLWVGNVQIGLTQFQSQRISISWSCRDFTIYILMLVIDGYDLAFNSLNWREDISSKIVKQSQHGIMSPS